MRAFNKTAVFILAATFTLALVGPATALAATDPNLGAVASFSVLAQTGITGTGTISGNVENNGIAAAITALTTAMVGGTIYSSDAGSTLGAPPAATTLLNAAVQTDASTAYTTTIPGEGSDGSIGPVLDGLVLTPGVYDIGAGRLNGGVLHLNGPGIYILRASSDLISSGSIDLQNGARACDVYWNVQTLATINGSSFAGTILAGTGVHFGAGVTLDGRALAIGGDVTMLDDTISGPSCPPPPATLTVTKIVHNNHGGTKVVSDFPLFINLMGVTSGVASTTLVAGPYTVSETSDSGYTSTISGDCAADGTITLFSGDANSCTITNNDIAPPPPPPPPSGGNGPPVGSLPAPINIPGEVLGTSTSIVVPVVVIAPAPAPAVPLASLPYTGYSLADEVSKTVSFAIPSAIFALAITLVLFRKRE